MLAVVARKPRALIRPVEPMTVPLGFRSQTWPFAVIVPSILKGVDPLLRLSVIDPGVLGWTKFRVSPAFNWRTDQSSTARGVVCVTVKVLVTTLLAVTSLLANVASPLTLTGGVVV